MFDPSGPVTMLYALCPSRGAAACPVKDIQLAGDTLTVRLTDAPALTVRFKGL